VVETKYGRYLITDLKGKHPHPEIMAPIVHLRGENVYGGVNLTTRTSYMTLPHVNEKTPHAHDFDEFLYFLGGNPADFFDYGAEAELYLGEEGEKHIINTTTVVYIPRGLIHCPLIFTRVDKPVMFMTVSFTSKYVKATISE